MGNENKVDKGVEVTPQVAEKLTAYVENKYSEFKGKTLTIRDKGTHYTIKHNITGAPLFLSKDVI